MRKTFRPGATRCLAALSLAVPAVLATSILALPGCEGGSPEAKTEAPAAGGAGTSGPAASKPGTSERAKEQAGQITGLPKAGHWRGSLLSPGGPLTFGLDFEEEPEGLRAFLINGSERRPAGLVQETDGGIEFAIPPYRSRLVATLESDGSSLVGAWERDHGGPKPAMLPFAAVDDATPPKIPELSGEAVSRISGRWAVQFEGDEDPSVGLFQVEPSGRATGTFLTTLGDYRYLAGYSDGNALHLSCFDGAHAFLFTARRQSDGTLQGDFWSRNTYHTTWSAEKSKDAALPDDFALTEWVGGVPLSEVRFTDAEGTLRSLDDETFRAKARVLVLFGTWCPNCNDLTEYLVQLDRQYDDLGIVGIAFELGDDPAAHRRAIADYAAHHGATYPILVGGISDKAAASAAFPLVDRIRAYPTTVFMDGEGNVSAVHTGFSGPATGDAYDALRTRFESEIESLLARD
ncbi:thiol-disulfide oxidoreductase [Planctomycetes bacterium Poly30]|uniref:Thiol-disulfide oxidoreductase n=1 Tax=Saltatorellus ferox TaxID=2528018 RepID=A0A518EMN9_9BACT|nr:thiol-disulfide oxidoreductase [Planctomycetes bacterium Poly30]